MTKDNVVREILGTTEVRDGCVFYFGRDNNAWIVRDLVTGVLTIHFADGSEVSTGKLGRSATYVIAAANATDKEKAQADIVCSGVSSLVATIANGATGVVSVPGAWVAGTSKTVTNAGDFVVTLAAGQTGWCWSGTALVSDNNGEPVALAAGANTIHVLGTGTIFIGGMGDEVTINTSIAALRRTVGASLVTGLIQFTSGTFNIYDRINFYGWTVFRGQGVISTSFYQRSACDVFFWAGGDTTDEYFCVWEDMVIQGTYLRGRGISCPKNGTHGLNDSRINKCMIDGFGDWSVYLGQPWGWVISNSVLEHSPGGGLFVAGGGWLTLSDDKIDYGSVSGRKQEVDDYVYISGGGHSLIENCQFEDTGRRALHFQNSANIKITNCSFLGSSHENPKIWESVFIEGDASGTVCEDIEFANCTFNAHSYITGTDTARAGLLVSSGCGSKGISLVGCNFKNFGTDSVPILDYSGNVKISNCPGIVSMAQGVIGIPKDNSATGVTLNHGLTLLPMSDHGWLAYDAGSYIGDNGASVPAAAFILRLFNKIFVDADATSCVVTLGAGVYGLAVSGATTITGSPQQLSPGANTINFTNHDPDYFYIYLSNTANLSYLSSTGTYKPFYCKRKLNIGVNTVAVIDGGAHTLRCNLWSGVTGIANGCGITNQAVVSGANTLTINASGDLTITLSFNPNVVVTANAKENAGAIWIDNITASSFRINMPAAIAVSTSDPIEAAKGTHPDSNDLFYRTSELAAATNNTTNDITLLPVSPAVNDAYYVVGTDPFYGVKVKQTTAGVGTWVITAEYWNGSAWTALAGVTDGTSGWTVVDAAAGKDISWTIPADWKPLALKNAYGYAVRFRVSSFTSKTTSPVGDRIYLLNAVSIGWRASTVNQG